MKLYKDKYFSIVGDSISTFFGYAVKSFYGLGNLAERGSSVNSVDDTWWMQVINNLGGKFLENNSYSGSLVVNHPECAPESCSCSDKRTSNLHKDGVSPDVIMIYMGTNDSGWNVPIDGEDGDTGNFKSAYMVMLDKIKRNYPYAEIWCFTLCRRVGNDCEYMNAYCNSIRDCVKVAGCRLIELYAHPRCYETCDGLHPNADGMRTIAEVVLGQVVQ